MGVSCSSYLSKSEAAGAFSQFCACVFISMTAPAALGTSITSLCWHARKDQARAACVRVFTYILNLAVLCSAAFASLAGEGVPS